MRGIKRRIVAGVLAVCMVVMTPARGQAFGPGRILLPGGLELDEAGAALVAVIVSAVMWIEAQRLGLSSIVSSWYTDIATWWQSLTADEQAALNEAAAPVVSASPGELVTVELPSVATGAIERYWDAYVAARPAYEPQTFSLTEFYEEAAAEMVHVVTVATTAWKTYEPIMGNLVAPVLVGIYPAIRYDFERGKIGEVYYDGEWYPLGIQQVVYDDAGQIAYTEIEPLTMLKQWPASIDLRLQIRHYDYCVANGWDHCHEPTYQHYVIEYDPFVDRWPRTLINRMQITYQDWSEVEPLVIGWLWDNAPLSVTWDIPHVLPRGLGMDTAIDGDATLTVVIPGDVLLENTETGTVSVSVTEAAVGTIADSIAGTIAPPVEWKTPPGRINLEPLRSLPITTAFPFSIPWDVTHLVGLLDVQPVRPRFMGKIGGYEVELDLDWLDGIMAAARWGELLVFVGAAAVAIRRWMGGAV